MTTTVDEPLLSSGDLVWVDLRPTKGHEQAGVRPAVVLTDSAFHQRNATAIICPITSYTRPWPTKVILPAGLPVAGAVLADQIRCVDRSSRGFRRVGAVPASVLAEIRLKVALLIGAVTDAEFSGSAP
ncbi:MULTISPECIES: type II toxin-antitoxin system PemK/MazF family toxin [Methylobacterium]|uniref:mRNA interferase n=1 Tax=Methylobacterium thuringiense TaxID=1003091 RepID=A0ABQ4TGG2_9HYPH|nr:MULTISPECIES: type II toxin-antitoxin system PemK/MazF family toxin [Methylobacterium]TXN24039.1 type II toxin-antitoxin system PemK/MazF family toxin [Methylobacterium sp. WL9]GJE54494.1 Endoribonuclease toxin MazF [Methylobacterium thuringiense]